MKKTLIKKKVSLLLGAFMLSFLIVFFVNYNYEKKTETIFMTYIIEEVEVAYNNFAGDPQSFIAANINDNNRRITILDSDGFVLADTHNYIVGRDLSKNPEILNIGVVYTTNSQNRNANLLIIAKQTTGNNYLIVAVESDVQPVSYYWVIWILAVSALLTIYYLKLVKLNERNIASWKQIKDNLQLFNKGECQELPLNSDADEINEVIREINEIKTLGRVSAQRAYQVRLDEILNQIKQGVMLYDQNERLIYYNSDAKKMFSITDDALKKSSNYLIRNNEIKTAIKVAIENKELATFDFEQSSKIIEAKVFSISATDDDQSQTTVLALFKDVSQQRAMEQMKRDFFAHASHELKSPLTAIKGYAELIALGVVKGPEIEKSAIQIAKQTDTMSSLVENMLMLSKIENLKEKSYNELDLETILIKVIEQLMPRAKRKSIKLNIESTSVKMKGDEFDLAKMFKNLIENAINYSEENKEVFIELIKQGKEVVFIVKDQGIGISKEHQHRVFERFYRVDKGRLDGGTGLGLAIVKHIVLNYKGVIDLRSSLVKGTEITIRIPQDIRQ